MRKKLKKKSIFFKTFFGPVSRIALSLNVKGDLKKPDFRLISKENYIPARVEGSYDLSLYYAQAYTKRNVKIREKVYSQKHPKKLQLLSPFFNAQ